MSIRRHKQRGLSRRTLRLISMYSEPRPPQSTSTIRDRLRRHGYGLARPAKLW